MTIPYCMRLREQSEHQNMNSTYGSGRGRCNTLLYQESCL